MRLAVSPETLDASVPNLVLQPIVENAIRHGIAPRSSAGRIEIRAERRDGMIELQVIDLSRHLDENSRLFEVSRSLYWGPTPVTELNSTNDGNSAPRCAATFAFR